MRRAKLILAAAAAVGLSGQLVFGVDYTWQSFAGGSYLWNGAGVWSPAGFPNADGDSGNVSGPITGGALNIALPGNFTVSTLTVGATGSLFPTDIGNNNSGGGMLILDNGAGAGTSTIIGAGVDGAVTTFSAPIQLGTAVGAGTALVLSNFRVEGNAGVYNFNNVTVFGDPDAGDGTAITRRLLILNAGSATTGSTYNFGAIALSQAGAVRRGELEISTSGINNPTVTFAHGGTVNFNGVISNGGNAGDGALRLGYGSSGSSQPPVPTTFVFHTTNTYTGPTNLGKANYLLKANNAFGTGQINAQYAANTYSATLMSDNDARFINNNIQLQNNLTVDGDNSLTLNGAIFQSNNRELTNLLPVGKVLTINGFLAAALGTDGNTETARALTIDGSGKTVVNGPIYNHRSPWLQVDAGLDRAVDPDFGLFGGIAKRGTGVLTINSTVLPTVSDGTTSFTGPTSTILAPTSVTGGLLEFLNPAAYGKIVSYTGGSLTINNSPGTSRINVLAGGAIGVLDGTITDEFIAKLNASTFALGNDGGLALATADAAKNLDFTSTLSGGGVARMSVGAVSAGVTYTGTITPNPALGYRLGGGGTLTLPNANQLTGARNVTVTNGGAVAMTNTNNYTGVTTVRGDYIQSNTTQAEANANSNSFINFPAAIRNETTLVVSNLGNGSTNSSIGASSSAASNLVLAGGTLKYVGGATSSDRLFSIDTTGATLDASGTGALNLTNTGAAAVLDVGTITAATLSTGGNARLLNGVSDISRVTPGMIVTAESGGVATFLPADATVQGVVPNFGFTGGSPFILNNQIIVSAGAGTTATNANLTFANQDRNLNLTGTNTGANTLAALLADSAAGQLGVVKSGSGNWALTNTNTFSGGVTVNAGQLQVNRVRNNGTTTINGGTLKIAPGTVGNAANTSVFTEGGFSIAGGATPAGKFDLSKSGAVFEYDTTSPELTVRALIDSAYGASNWAGNGITSSNAAADPNNHAVGYSEASDIGSPATFLGVSIDSTTVLARYTRQGDANLDGIADLGDFALLGANFNTPTAKWSKGDFNYDGNTDLGDFALLAANFNQAATGDLPRGGAVPEPASLGLLAAGLIGLRRRRR